MAKTSKLEKKAHRAIARAQDAIDEAQHAAKKLDRKTRAEAEKLTRKLEKAIVPKPAKGAKPTKAVKTAKAAKPTKAAKPAKSTKAVKAVKPPKPSKGATPAKPAETSVTPAAARPDYRTVAMLRGQAKTAGVHGFSTMTRAQLIDALAAV